MFTVQEEFENFYSQVKDSKTAALLCIASSLKTIALGANFGHELTLALKTAMAEGSLNVDASVRTDV